MTDASFTVDTHPLADTMSEVSDRVEGTKDAIRGTTQEIRNTTKMVSGTKTAVGATTAAVGATTAAVETMMQKVVKTEKEAAEKVSRHVTSGFISLVRAELAQKKIEVQTHMMSKCQVLGHFNQMLSRRQKQLRDDYERISKRYKRIIEDLNGALKTRIYNLDAPAVEVADLGYGLQNKRMLIAGAALPIVEQDVQPLASHLRIAHCKDDCARAMVEVKEMVVHLQRLRRAMEASVRDVRLSDKRRRTMPVLIIEAEDPDVGGMQKTDLVVGDRCEQQDRANSIRSQFYERRGDFSWQEAGNGRDIVLQKIEERANEAHLDARTRKWVMQMASASTWQELGGIK